MKTLLFQKFQRKNQNNALYRTKENHSSDSLIRLAYFNVMEEEDQNRDETGAKIYTGLPVTSAALIFPAVLLIHMLIRADLTFLYFGVMLITGGLFFSKIQIKKPQNKGIATMIFFGAVECVVLIFR